jgi:hypothetical protein
MPLRPLSSRATSVLVVTAEPHDQARIATDVESRNINKALKAARAQRRATLDWCPAADLTDFIDALQEDPPAIVYLTGHGTQDSIFFQQHDHTSNAVPAAPFSNMLHSYHDHVKLVIVSACDSDQIAEQITKVIDNAIGFQGTVTASQAAHFAYRFFYGLTAGKKLGDAFEEAKRDLAAQNIGAVPALHPSNQDAPNKFFNRITPPIDSNNRPTILIISIIFILTIVSGIIAWSIFPTASSGSSQEANNEWGKLVSFQDKEGHPAPVNKHYFECGDKKEYICDKPAESDQADCTMIPADVFYQCRAFVEVVMPNNKKLRVENCPKNHQPTCYICTSC